MEAERGSRHRAFESRRGFRISHKPIGHPEGKHVHRSRRRYAHVPEALAARIVLNRSLHTRFQDLNRSRVVRYAAEKTRWKSARAEFGIGNDAAKVIEIGFQSFEACDFHRFA